MKRERAFGINAVEGVLNKRPEQVIRVWIAPNGKRIDALEALARNHGIAIERTQPAALNRLAGSDAHQGVVAEFRASATHTEADLDRIVAEAGDRTLLVLLDRVQDPHNLGACLRSAAAAGAHAVVVPRDRAAGLTAAVRRAAAGAAEYVPLIEVANLARAIERLHDAGVWCVGLAGEAGTVLQETDLTGPLALVLGGEDRGLRSLTRKRCDALAGIPMPGAIESLNVSVAAGIALFEALRQRRTK